MNHEVRKVSITQGIATMEDGTAVNLNAVQAALNAAFTDTGDDDYRKAIDAGIRKINYYTYGVKYAGEAVQQGLFPQQLLHLHARQHPRLHPGPHPLRPACPQRASSKRHRAAH